jgi:multiple sugar transport system permease protein
VSTLESDLEAPAPELRLEPVLNRPDMPEANPVTGRDRRGVWLARLFLGVLGLLFALPMLWLILASVDSKASWSVELPHWTFQNFSKILSNNSGAMVNSVVLSVVSTLIATVTAVLAAYALSRKKIPLKRSFMLGVLFLSAVPIVILIVPVYQMFADLGWLSLIPTALFLAVTSLPFEIYLIKNFLDAVPRDLEEAARIENANTFQVLTKVVIPLAFPGITAAAIFGFITAWGSFLIPLVLIASPSQAPASIAVYGYMSSSEILYGDIAAFSLVFAVPVFILYAISGRAFSGGFILRAAVKG